MSLLIFRTDSTDLFHPDRVLSDPSQPRMMRLEATLFDKEWRTINSMDCLIRPDGWVPNAGAAASHGITTRRCELYGVRTKAALAMFVDMVRSTMELAAWSLPFHRGIVDVELIRLGAKPDDWKRGGLKRTDIMTEASRKWSNGKNMKIEAAAQIAFGHVWATEGPSLSKMDLSIGILQKIRDYRGPGRD